MSGNGFDTVGITGYSQLASVTDSVNKDTVSGNENTGGIAGKISASGTADLYCKMETSDCKDCKIKGKRLQDQIQHILKHEKCKNKNNKRI